MQLSILVEMLRASRVEEAGRGRGRQGTVVTCEKSTYAQRCCSVHAAALFRRRLPCQQPNLQFVGASGWPQSASLPTRWTRMQLAELDAVKQRMEDACSTLKEAAGLSALFARVDDLIATGDLRRLADALAGMRRGLAVVGDSVAEFRGGYVYKQWLESYLLCWMGSCLPGVALFRGWRLWAAPRPSCGAGEETAAAVVVMRCWFVHLVTDHGVSNQAHACRSGRLAQPRGALVECLPNPTSAPVFAGATGLIPSWPPQSAHCIFFVSFFAGATGWPGWRSALLPWPRGRSRPRFPSSRVRSCDAMRGRVC